MADMPGYVYVLSNPSMPGIVKIGRSINGGRSRAKSIYQTGVPEPFDLEFEVYCVDCVYAERAIHERLNGERVSPSREFFKVDIDDAIEAVMDEVASLYDRCVRNPDCIVDEDFIGYTAYKLSQDEMHVHPAELAMAFRFIEKSALIEAVNRYKDWVNDRRTRLQNEGSL